MSAEQVCVNVEHRLTGIRSRVEHQTELTVRALCRNVVRDGDELGKQCRIAGGKLDDVAVLLGLDGDHDVNGSLRGDVFERNDVVGFRDNSRWDLARDDAAEDRRCCGLSPWSG